MRKSEVHAVEHQHTTVRDMTNSASLVHSSVTSHCLENAPEPAMLAWWTCTQMHWKPVRIHQPVIMWPWPQGYHLRLGYYDNKNPWTAQWSNLTEAWVFFRGKEEQKEEHATKLAKKTEVKRAAKWDEKRGQPQMAPKQEAERAVASERDLGRGLRKKSKKLTKLCTKLWFAVINSSRYREDNFLLTHQSNNS